MLLLLLRFFGIKTNKNVGFYLNLRLRRERERPTMDDDLLVPVLSVTHGSGWTGSVAMATINLDTGSSSDDY